LKRILLKICYDGTNYHGWQGQPNAITIQETMQNALFEMIGVNTSVTGCSRTDAGVHAKEFYCHFDCNDTLPDTCFIKGLNSLLPRDISVLDSKRVDDDFHSRYNAKGKNYIYSFYNGIRNPFLDRYALNINEKIDLSLMNEFCKTIIGTHDFYGFSSSKRTVEDTVRTVSECRAYEKDGKILFDITANGFLYNMVRILAGTAFDVSTKKLTTDIANEIFNTKDRALGGNTLKPNGLSLNKVIY